MATATKARTIHDVALDNGWTLDPTQTVDTFRGYGYRWHEMSAEEKASYIKQDPNSFERPAADGGTWKVRFEFNEGRGHVLRAAHLRYFDADGVERVIGSDDYKFALSGTSYAYYDPETDSRNGNWPGNPNSNIGAAVLANPNRYSGLSTSWLWEVTRNQTDDGPLRKSAALLLANPDLLVWLAAEAQYQAEVHWAAERAEKARIKALKDKLPEGWLELRQAARAIVNAHGLDDHQALIDALIEAAANVEVGS